MANLIQLIRGENALLRFNLYQEDGFSQIDPGTMESVALDILDDKGRSVKSYMFPSEELRIGPDLDKQLELELRSSVLAELRAGNYSGKLTLTWADTRFQEDTFQKDITVDRLFSLR